MHSKSIFASLAAMMLGDSFDGSGTVTETNTPAKHRANKTSKAQRKRQKRARRMNRN